MGSCFKIRRAKTIQGVDINSNLLEERSSRESVIYNSHINILTLLGTLSFQIQLKVLLSLAIGGSVFFFAKKSVGRFYAENVIGS